jgi:hypothetical protein
MKPLVDGLKRAGSLEVSRHACIFVRAFLRTWRFLFTNCGRKTEDPGKLCFPIQQDTSRSTVTEQAPLQNAAECRFVLALTPGGLAELPTASQ